MRGEKRIDAVVERQISEQPEVYRAITGEFNSDFETLIDKLKKGSFSFVLEESR